MRSTAGGTHPQAASCPYGKPYELHGKKHTDTGQAHDMTACIHSTSHKLDELIAHSYDECPNQTCIQAGCSVESVTDRLCKFVLQAWQAYSNMCSQVEEADDPASQTSLKQKCICEHCSNRGDCHSQTVGKWTTVCRRTTAHTFDQNADLFTQSALH